MTGFSKNSQKLASEYPQPSQNTPQIPLMDVKIFTPHSFFQSLMAMSTSKDTISVQNNTLGFLPQNL